MTCILKGGGGRAKYVSSVVSKPEIMPMKDTSHIAFAVISIWISQDVQPRRIPVRITPRGI